MGALIATAALQARTLSPDRTVGTEFASDRRAVLLGEHAVSRDGVATTLAGISMLPLREYLYAPRDPLTWGTMAEQDVELPPMLALSMPITPSVPEARAKPMRAPKPGRDPALQRDVQRPSRVVPRPDPPQPPRPAWVGKTRWRNAPSTSWYGPGLYGNRTACGQTYTRRIVGVAHRTLPCGTRVQLRWRGMTVVVQVIDRGPYGHPSNVFDLSARLACHVLRPAGERDGCYTRHNVRWRVVERSRAN